MTRKLLFACTLFSAAAAVAGGPCYAQLSAEYGGCMARAHNSIVQQGMCEQKELTNQDARLNKAYQQLMQQYSGHEDKRTALRNEERSWLKKRDYDCKLDKQTIDNSCLVSKTSERADVLEKQLQF